MDGVSFSAVSTNLKGLWKSEPQGNTGEGSGSIATLVSVGAEIEVVLGIG